MHLILGGRLFPVAQLFTTVSAGVFLIPFHFIISADSRCFYRFLCVYGRRKPAALFSAFPFGLWSCFGPPALARFDLAFFVSGWSSIIVSFDLFSVSSDFRQHSTLYVCSLGCFRRFFTFFLKSFSVFLALFLLHFKQNSVPTFVICGFVLDFHWGSPPVFGFWYSVFGVSGFPFALLLGF